MPTQLGGSLYRRQKRSWPTNYVRSASSFNQRHPLHTIRGWYNRQTHGHVDNKYNHNYNYNHYISCYNTLQWGASHSTTSEGHLRTGSEGACISNCTTN